MIASMKKNRCSIATRAIATSWSRREFELMPFSNIRKIIEKRENKRRKSKKKN